MAIIVVGDLPTALQSAEMIDTMVTGANARAVRVAPCLIEPTTTWAATTVYVVGDRVRLNPGESVEVTVAGTSAATAPAAPVAVGDAVTDGTVTWSRIAPTLDHLAEAKLVLVGAVQRWAEAGAGALQSQQAGPFGMTVDTRQRTGFNLWPSEIKDLQELCRSADTSTGAFSVTPSGSGSGHIPWCAIEFGALYCSCGYDLTGVTPIYEVGGDTVGDYY